MREEGEVGKKRGRVDGGGAWLEEVEEEETNEGYRRRRGS